MSRLKDLKNLYLIETEINESLETLCNELIDELFGEDEGKYIRRILEDYMENYDAHRWIPHLDGLKNVRNEDKERHKSWKEGEEAKKS